MDLFLITLLAVLLISSIVSVAISIRRDGRGHLPPVPSGRPWNGSELADVSALREMYNDQQYQPRFR
ncbi:hypothetical protein [Arthrobacter sp.]|uniref:hypothetical protein n=1 Tax=Arthrobacter sp. TaxID=1667 RepID=UPI00289796C1|nr:hypothetical protein [Arthrobacter sp.]